MTRKEHIKLAQQAFIDRGFWPNEVMWECWKDAWLAGVAAEREPAIKESLTPQRPWVGLTDADFEKEKFVDYNFMAGARFAETKLKEKNG